MLHNGDFVYSDKRGVRRFEEPATNKRVRNWEFCYISHHFELVYSFIP